METIENTDEGLSVASMLCERMCKMIKELHQDLPVNQQKERTERNITV